MRFARIKKHLHDRSGFSLTEILIVVAIAGGVVIVISNFGSNVSGLNSLIQDNLQSKSDISQTLQIMAGEIRGASPSAAGAYPIIVAGTSSFSFYDSINGNGIVDYVSYYLASSTIYRAVIAPTGSPATYATSSQVVYDEIDNVSLVSSSTPLFSYYGTSYTGSSSALASPVTIASIRLVQIAFTSVTQKNPSQPSPPQYFSTLIDMRNLDSN